MTIIYNYDGKYQTPEGNKKYHEGERISLYDVMKLTKDGLDTDQKQLWRKDDEKGTDYLVFFNKDAMKFFAMEASNIKVLKVSDVKYTVEGTNKDFKAEEAFTGTTIDEIKKKVEELRKTYDELETEQKKIVVNSLNRVFELTADIQTKQENYREMDNLYKEVSSGVMVSESTEKLVPVKLPTANISSSSSHGSTGWSKMKGGAVSSEIASILHLLEYNNAVNNNFVNNVLPTLKGGATLDTIDWELEHFITNSKNNEKLFNTITRLANNARSEPLKVYLRKLRHCIARAQGISHILKNNPDLLTKTDETSSKILDQIRKKIGKYTTDLKKKEEAAVKSFKITAIIR